MLLWTIRALFLLILAGAGAKVANDFSGYFGWEGRGIGPVLLFCSIVSLGVLAIVVDLCYPRKKISTLSAVYFGLLIGILLGHLLGVAFGPTLRMLEPPLAAVLPRNPVERIAPATLTEPFSLVATCVLCYIAVSFLLQTKDDFRFIIPYVEFSKQLEGRRPLVVDASVLIDGRLADIAETGLVDQTVTVPRSVLQEIQAIADSPDRARRARGRRGLDVVDRLQRCPRVRVEIIPDAAPGADADAHLVRLTRDVNGRLATNDQNLAKFARIQGVETVSLHEVSTAARPPVLQGDTLRVHLVREGEEPGQGVGFLDDGTMVVAEMGRPHVGTEVAITVTSILQTAAGRMVFGRLERQGDRPGERPGPDQRGERAGHDRPNEGPRGDGPRGEPQRQPTRR